MKTPRGQPIVARISRWPAGGSAGMLGRMSETRCILATDDDMTEAVREAVALL